MLLFVSFHFISVLSWPLFCYYYYVSFSLFLRTTLRVCFLSMRIYLYEHRFVCFFSSSELRLSRSSPLSLYLALDAVVVQQAEIVEREKNLCWNGLKGVYEFILLIFLFFFFNFSNENPHIYTPHQNALEDPVPFDFSLRSRYLSNRISSAANTLFNAHTHTQFLLYLFCRFFFCGYFSLWTLELISLKHRLPVQCVYLHEKIKTNDEEKKIKKNKLLIAILWLFAIENVLHFCQ